VLLSGTVSSWFDLYLPADGMNWIW